MLTLEKKTSGPGLSAGFNFVAGVMNMDGIQASPTPCYWWGFRTGDWVNVAVNCNKDHSSMIFTVAWEKSTTSIIQARWYDLTNIPPTQVGNILQVSNGACAYNHRPSVANLQDGRILVSWIGDQYNNGDPYGQHLQYWSERNPGRYYLLDAGVQSVSLNVPDNNTMPYIAYGKVLGSFHGNYYTDSTCFSPRYLPTSGQDVQLSNGPTKGSMYVSSFYPFSLPYYFQTTPPLANYKEDAATASKWNSGRGFTIGKGDLQFCCSIEGLRVDGRSIGFVHAPDSLDFTSLENINRVLLSEPFSVGRKSRIILRERAGFVDSAVAAAVLGPNGLLSYKLDLVDDATGKVVRAVEAPALTSANSHGNNRNSSLISVKGIEGKTLRLKATVSTNLDSLNVALLDSYLPETAADSAANSSLASAEGQPIEFAMIQNYPNPFNPTTQIRFDMPEDANVSLVIYDVLGREVATVVKGNLEAGYHTATWNASGSASGVYFARFTVRDEFGGAKFTKVNKLLLVK